MSRIVAKCVLLLPGLMLGVQTPDYEGPVQTLEAVLWNAQNPAGHGDLRKVDLYWTSQDYTQRNQHVVREYVKRDWNNLRYAPRSWRGFKPIVLAAVKQDPDALYDADDVFQDDKDVMLEVVRQNGRMLQYARYLKADREVVMEALKQTGEQALNYASFELRNDRDFMLEAVKEDGDAIVFAAGSLKADRDIVLAALGQQARQFQDAGAEEQEDLLKNVRDARGYDFTWCRTALKHAAFQLVTDPEFMLKVVRVYGLALRDAPMDIKKDTDIVSAAILQNPAAFEFAAQQCRTEARVKELVEYINKHGLASARAHYQAAQQKQPDEPQNILDDPHHLEVEIQAGKNTPTD